MVENRKRKLKRLKEIIKDRIEGGVWVIFRKGNYGESFGIYGERK